MDDTILDEALRALPAPLAEAAGPVLRAPDFAGIVPAERMAALSGTAGLDDRALIQALVPAARAWARPPISGFRVGAVALGASGAAYFGVNLEFPGHSLNASGHGERGAVANAFCEGETRLAALAVSAAPCGYCRQFLWECDGAADMEILLPDRPARPLGAYLPDAFGPADLGIAERLLRPNDHGLRFEATDAVARAALDAANASHAPYSGCPAGVGIATRAGRVFAGRLAENAAYSPTQPPIEAALTRAALAGVAWDDLETVVLVQRPGPVDHTAETLAVLDAIAPRAELIVVGATPKA